MVTYSKTEKSKKEAYVKKHIVKDYLTYQEKIAEAKKIVEFSCYEEIQGKKVYKRNSPLAYMLYVLSIVEDYPEITWDKEKENLDVFNEFERLGVFDAIISQIPKKEHESFSTVLKMTSDDEYENFRSLAGFFDTKFDAISIMLEEATKLIERNQTE